MILHCVGAIMTFFPISKSRVPLEFDSLPALKAVYWDAAAQRRVYTQAKFYLLEDAVQVNLLVFEKQPEQDSAASFILCGTTACLVLTAQGPQAEIEVKPNGTSLNMLLHRERDKALPIAVQALSGQDEQGQFWGVKAEIPFALLKQAGIGLQEGEELSGGLVKHTGAQLGRGASFLLYAPNQTEKPNLNKLKIVDY